MARTPCRSTLIVLTMALLCAGCASRSKTPDPGEYASGAPGGLAASLSALTPGSGSVRWDEIWVESDKDRRFQYTLNGESHEVLRRAQGDPTTKQTVSWFNAKSGDLQSSLEVGPGEGGGLASPTSTNIDRGVVSRFQPPMVVLPATLTKGEGKPQQIRVMVSDADRPGRIKHRGSGTNTVELAGESSIEAGGRTIKCIVVRTIFDATFGPADVYRVSHQWFEIGKGLVAEYAHEEVRTFGIQTEDRHESWIAAE